MPQGTYEITGFGTGAAPFDVPVNSVNGFDLLSVFASFDGTAAAGDFLPCVQILSSAGHVMAQTIGSTVTAGGSADVTFGPFLRAQTTGGGGITEIESTDGTVSVTNPFGPIVDLSTTTSVFQPGNYVSGASTTVGPGGLANLALTHIGGTAAPLNLAAPSLPKITNAGIYAFTGYVSTTSNVSAGRNVVADLDIANAVTVSGRTTATGPVGGGLVDMGIFGTARVAANTLMVVEVFNLDTVNVDFFLTALCVQRLF